MQFAIAEVVMAGNYQARRKAAHFFRTGGKQFRYAVQDGRRFVDVEKVAGEQVAAEQQIVLWAVETAMPAGMPTALPRMNGSNRRTLMERRSFQTA